jgi:hypothetical protein
MKKVDNLKSIFQTVCLLVLFLLLISEDASAWHLFQTQNTWYDKIPSNPVLYSDSANYINDIILSGYGMSTNYGEWSVPVYYAPSGTSNVTVTLNSPSSPYCGSHSIANGWNIVPIPSGALPAGNAASCAGSYRDGHMVVYNDQYVWELAVAKYCSGKWTANCVRRYDRSGTGVVDPYDLQGTCRACSGATLSLGLVLKSEIDAGEINHALAFCYDGEKLAYHYSRYPCEAGREGINPRTYAMLLGERIQLNPSVDCNSLGLNNFGKIICKAMQDYGMIFVENCTESTSVYIENRANGAQSLGDWSGIWGNISAIPINQMRVVKPVCSDCAKCPNCTSSTISDTTPPAPPAITGVQ